MGRIRAAVIEGGIWLLFAGAAFALTFQFDEPLSQYRYGAAGWPRVIIIGIALFGGIQAIWRCLAAQGREHYMGEVEEGPSPSEATGTKVHLKRWATFGMPIVYLFLMPRAGFYAITPFFLAGYMLLLGERRIRILVGTTLLIFALTILIFTTLLFVPLPVGNWPGFYEFNAFFVSILR
jgi:hypothetical protein